LRLSTSYISASSCASQSLYSSTLFPPTLSLTFRSPSLFSLPLPPPPPSPLFPYTTLFRSTCATPAMEAGISDQVWTIEEIVRLADRKSTRLNSSHGSISYAVFCLKKKKRKKQQKDSK